jgi:hypothetical protein
MIVVVLVSSGATYVVTEWPLQSGHMFPVAGLQLPLGSMIAENQYRATGEVLSIARRHIKNSGTSTDSDVPHFAKIVAQLNAGVSNPDDQAANIYYFARTCQDYINVSSSYTGTQEAYPGAFSEAYWLACERLSKYPGVESHQLLLKLKDTAPDDPAIAIDDLIDSQKSLK